MIPNELKLGCSLFVLLSVGACAEQSAAPPAAGPPQPELQVADESGGEAAPPPNAPEPSQAPAMPSAPPPPPSAGTAPQAPAAAPSGPPPATPAARAAPVAPPPVEPAPVEPAPAASGQWIYTNQYGWLWTPYARDYTYVSADGGVAYEYAYYPNYGWRWVYSPWVLGWGPHPYWGRLGPRYYVWHSRPWFRVGVGVRVRRGPVYRRRYRRY